jgi:hypothetical protein
MSFCHFFSVRKMMEVEGSCLVASSEIYFEPFCVVFWFLFLG